MVLLSDELLGSQLVHSKLFYINSKALKLGGFSNWQNLILETTKQNFNYVIYTAPTQATDNDHSFIPHSVNNI